MSNSIHKEEKNGCQLGAQPSKNKKRLKREENIIFLQIEKTCSMMFECYHHLLHLKYLFVEFD